MVFGENQLKMMKLELDIKFWIRSIIAQQIEIWKYDNNKKEKNTFDYLILIL